MFRFEETSSGILLKYATADRMRPDCVRCHNTHPDTPKTDWQVGDLRGVLEVALSLDAVVAETDVALQQTFTLLAIIGLLGLTGLTLVVNTIRRASNAAAEQATEMQRINEALHSEMLDRKVAETERMNLEEQVLQAQKLESLGVLAGGIAHDFNNLLTPILGNADLIREKFPPGSATRSAIEDIESAATSAADLCREMLAYAGKGAFTVRSIDLNTVTEEMVHLLEASISKKCVIEYDMAQHLPTFRGDVSQMRQIILNLIINASEAIGDENGVIRVRTYLREAFPPFENDPILDYLESSPCVVLEVADDGCGMSDETRKKIFDPFFTTKFTERGLGLAAVLGIVKAHRGAIVVTSEVGRFTRFELAFPAEIPRVAECTVSPTVEDDSKNSATLLLVDDEAPVLRLSEKVLRGAGFEVLTARDGYEAVRVFEQNESILACVVLDLTMPGMDGEQVLRKIRSIRSDIPIILCSGFDEAEIARRFERDGVSGFIHKPFMPSNLIAEVRAALADTPAMRAPTAES